jgi:hypothetical protein
VTRLKDDGRAGQDGEGGQDAERLKSHDVLHRQSHQSQRMPAPSVRAIDATSARTQVKRARFDFTSDSVWRSMHFGSGGRAVFLERSLALRPRLAAGLPWTDFERRTFVLTTQGT